MSSLDDFVESIPEVKLAVAQIDLSEQRGQPAGSLVFTYKEPTMAQLFQAQKDAPQIAARYPDFPTEMCATIAILALSHIAPPWSKPKGILYAEMAVKDNSLFLWLVASFMEKFPRLRDLEAAIMVEKKDSSADSKAP